MRIFFGRNVLKKVIENYGELEYHILNADSVLREALELLKINETTDFSIPDW